MEKNITPCFSSVTATERQKAMGQRGAVVWMTGLSGSGKSTIGTLLEKKLVSAGIKAYMLDGDTLRAGLNSDLGFSDSDRTENLRRTAYVAALLADTGFIVIVTAISPLSKHRDFARSVISPKAFFCETYIKTSLSECEKRDPKGLYKKAYAGEIKEFTGISSPFEPPVFPEITVDTVSSAPEECAGLITEYLRRAALLPEILPILCRIAVCAGKKIMEIYGTDFSFCLKDDKSPLTEADKIADTYINGELEALYPGIFRLSEETADDGKRLSSSPLSECFIIDPLDGTKEFIKRNGEFTVNIGLSLGGHSVLGVVYVPVSGTLYFAAKGCGAYKTNGCVERSIFGESLPGEAERISVSKRTDGLFLMTSRSHGDERTEALFEKHKDIITGTKASGSSLKGCLIAEGKADAYYRFGLTHEWDTCAMQCIAEEAGGIFRQGDGSFMNYNRKNTLNEKGFFIVNRSENIWTV